MSDHLQRLFYQEISAHLRAGTEVPRHFDWQLFFCRLASVGFLLVAGLFCHLAVKMTPELTAWLSCPEILNSSL